MELLCAVVAELSAVGLTIAYGSLDYVCKNSASERNESSFQIAECRWIFYKVTTYA